MHHINWMNRQDLETVLLKAVVLASHERSDDVAAAVETQCRVSHIWWHLLMNCKRRKKVAFLQCIDSTFLSFGVIKYFFSEKLIFKHRLKLTF